MTTITIQRVHPLSFAKISAFVYAMIGLILGAIFALLSLAGRGTSPMPMPGMFGAMFGVAAIVIFPILYGCFGFIASLIGAAIYNGAAKMVGGAVIDTQ